MTDKQVVDFVNGCMLPSALLCCARVHWIRLPVIRVVYGALESGYFSRWKREAAETCSREGPKYQGSLEDLGLLRIINVWT